MLTVGAEISEQRIGERLIGSARVATGVEIDLARVSRARVLIDPIARDAATDFQSVIAANLGNRVAEVDVSSW